MFSRIFPTIILTIASMVNAFAAPVVESADAVIIGGGVGGGAAAIYLGRAGFHPLVIEKSSMGGAIAQSDSVENWPGAIKIRGAELMENIRKQAEMNGAVFLNGEAVSVDFSKRPFTVVMRSLDNAGEIKTIKTKTCIIATGSSPNKLGIPGESEYWGRGISGCAICDGSLYQGKKVGVVGGGDAAILEAIYLANMAQNVTLFVRKEQLKGVDTKKKEALLSLPNVKVCYQTRLKEIVGNGQNITSVMAIHDLTSAVEKIDLDGLFLAIGAQPNTALFKGQIDLDERGYILLKKGQQTSVDGIYAIGDVVDPIYKQAISAAGDGAKAALAVIQTDLSLAPISGAVSRPLQKSVIEPQVLEITTLSQFEEEIRTSNIPLIIDFYATWCSPCKRIAPKLESTAVQLSGKVKFLKVNVDKLNALTKNYKIMAMPTVIYLDQSGVVLDRKVGESEISDLLAHLMVQ